MFTNAGSMYFSSATFGNRNSFWFCFIFISCQVEIYVLTEILLYIYMQDKFLIIKKNATFLNFLEIYGVVVL